MGEQIFSAVIAGGSTIIGAILGVLGTNWHYYRKIKKSSSGLYTLPEPRACASVYCDNVCSLVDKTELSFDFARFDRSEINKAFVSIVFSFPFATSFKRIKALSFDADFSNCNCTQIDMELQSENGIFKVACIKSDSRSSFQIELKGCVDNSILKSVKRICFVIKPSYHSEGSHCFGSISISNIHLK